MSTRRIFIALVGCLTACRANAAPTPVSNPSLPSAPLPSPSAAAGGPASATPEPPAAVAVWQAEPLPLPGAAGAVSLDYLFFEPQKSRIWVPAGGTGSVDVFDLASHAFSRIDGFKTAEREARGKKRTLGPSAGAIGDGFAYIGNRATQEVCAIDVQTLKTRSCLTLSAATDGVEYVAATHEVWVTTPQAQALAVLDVSTAGTLKPKSTIPLPGEPEGYAVDEPRGVFLTNLEDKGSTLAIDLATHAVRETWHAGCSSDGPRGIAVDPARGFAFVACTDHVQALDIAHGGALLGKLDTGGGVDNIDYVPATGLIYVAAGKAARLTVARVGAHADFSVVATGVTAPGARNAIADSSGNAYVADGQAGRLLWLSPPH